MPRRAGILAWKGQILSLEGVKGEFVFRRGEFIFGRGGFVFGRGKFVFGRGGFVFGRGGFVIRTDRSLSRKSFTSISLVWATDLEVVSSSAVVCGAGRTLLTYVFTRSNEAAPSWSSQNISR
eukprot:1171730-Prorocentrum_minimum.AAC.1